MIDPEDIRTKIVSVVMQIVTPVMVVVKMIWLIITKTKRMTIVTNK